MTTLKEYKAMMDGATDLLKGVLCDHDGRCVINGNDADRKAVDEALEKLSIAGGNLTPDLIRVIELAEKSLHRFVNATDSHPPIDLMNEIGRCSVDAKTALSEIRKLRGE